MRGFLLLLPSQLHCYTFGTTYFELMGACIDRYMLPAQWKVQCAHQTHKPTTTTTTSTRPTLNFTTFELHDLSHHDVVPALDNILVYHVIQK